MSKYDLINEDLVDSPEKVNDDPTGEGWFYKIKPSNTAEFDDLMDDEAYQSLLESLA